MDESVERTNIVLIGMPGVGKSTAGVLLAKRLSLGFIDTDVAIQAHTGRRLQYILDAEGIEAFCRMEEEAVLALAVERHVVATGGSVVYGDAAMGHLRAGGVIVHLDLPFDALASRIRNLDSRGVVMPGGVDLRGLYERRLPLYRRWAERTVDCSGRDLEEVVDELERCVRR